MELKTNFKSSLKLLLTLFTLLACQPSLGLSEDFAIFDGRVYNGKFYPRVDIIEWGTPSHMEFQIYSKSMPMDLSFELESKTGKPVMLVRYHIKDRNEHVCRRVVAPSHFKEGQALHVYKDVSDKDMDNIIVSPSPIPPKDGMVELKQAKYAACTEASATARLPAAHNDHQPRVEENKAEENDAPAAASNSIEEVSPGGSFLKW